MPPTFSRLLLFAVACWSIAPVSRSWTSGGPPLEPLDPSRLIGRAQEPIASEPDLRPVFLIPVEGEIEKALYLILNRALRKAARQDARAVVLVINTPGGEMNAATMIRDRLIEFESERGDRRIPTYAYVKSKAISAGALIALSTDTIVMGPASSIGDALPISIGVRGATAADEKVISFFAGEMRKTAKHKGHPEEIAEAMVDPDIRIRGVVDRGDILTLDNEQAVELGVAAYQADSIDKMLEREGLAASPRVDIAYTPTDAVARFLVNPVVSAILLLLGVGGLFFEVKTPGVGAPGAIGLSALAIYFFGSYLANLSGYMEIIFFSIGLGLLLIEIFVVPGFGVFGISGLVLIVGSLFFALFNLSPSGFSFPMTRLVGPLWSIVGASVAFVPFALFMSWLLPQTRLYRGSILLKAPSAPPDEAEMAAIDAAAPPAISRGSVGVAVGDLRPSGVAEFAGVRFDVLTEGEFVARGERLEVMRVEGNRIFVRAISARV
jgi:membrane-bound serine protease (ClpP class)